MSLGTTTPVSDVAVVRPPQRRSRAWRKHQRTGYGLIAPMMLGVFLFSLVPIVAVIILSFFKWNLVGVPHFIGFSNYSTAVHDSSFWQSLVTTAMYAAYNLPVLWIVALGLALILRRTVRGANVFRVILMVPWVTTPIAVATVWRWLLAPVGGVMNYLTGLLGLGSVNWLSSGNALRSLALAGVWQYVGYVTVIFLVGLQAIPDVYYEAARVDGASPLAMFLHVTLPQLRSTLLFVGVTTVLGSFQVFDLVYGLTQGGPGTSTRVLYYYIYQQTFSYLNIGYSSALCVLLLILLLGFTLIQVKSISRADTNN
jgi:multiple sugar transport system permease protein